ncbi:MAG: hypothetical protein AMXMBFR81_30470 [Chthonomonas sp.]
MSQLQANLMKAALDKVSAHRGQNAEFKGKYTTWVRRLPGLIQTSGLAQTVVFAKEKAAEDPAVKALLEDLKGTPGIGSDLIDRVKSADLQDYMFMSQRLLEAIVFYKRFCVSILEVKGVEE